MTDPRIARTKGRLHAALREACALAPLAEVSVSDVVRRARVARTTFYLHYDDLNALAVDSCAEIVRQAVDTLHSRPDFPKDPPPEIAELFEAIRFNTRLYRSLIGPGGGGPLGQVLHSELAERSRAERAARFGPSPAHAVAAAAVAGAFTGLIGDWLHGRCPCTADELAAHTWRMLGALHLTAFPPGDSP
ncbi:hypothetical protein [Actinocorallia longicatena]|uniref:TetR family transcriptional regulator n=1 Tax=Actinocorallia longicatena TaxID=111803 RepID=A0ABP6QDI2_9ACTN